MKLLELGAAGAAASADQGSSHSRTGESHTTSVTPVPAIPATVAGEFFHPYLSPEQVNGLHADARSDIFAAGALLYEMATGVPAFGGATVAEIAADINGKVPDRPRTRRPVIPAALDATIMKALEKAPDARFQRASELLEDLRRARRALERQATSRSWLGSRGRMAAFAAGVLTVVALVGTARWWWTGRNAPVPERSAILVSQIANGTADPDFEGTLREAVSVYLAQSPYLDLVSDERIRGMQQQMGRKPGEPMSHEVAAELCQRLGLQAMLEGSVSAVGRTTVVALAATDCHTGATIEKVDKSVERKEDVLSALGEITATHPPVAWRERRVAGQQQHADRGGDDAVARSVEGLHRSGSRGAPPDPRSRRWSCSSVRSRSIRSSHSRTRRCRASMAASARPAAARSMRGSPTSIATGSASASGSSSPTSSTIV